MFDSFVHSRTSSLDSRFASLRFATHSSALLRSLCSLLLFLVPRLSLLSPRASPLFSPRLDTTHHWRRGSRAFAWSFPAADRETTSRHRVRLPEPGVQGKN